MPKYMVVIKEVHESYREVHADSEDEAKDIALGCADNEVELRYVRTLGELEDIEVSEIQDEA